MLDSSAVGEYEPAFQSSGKLFKSLLKPSLILCSCSCQDEWDVYLDAINRKEISNTLMSFGLKHLDYQFLFISPQGAGDIKYDAADSRKVSILEVEKPK